MWLCTFKHLHPRSLIRLSSGCFRDSQAPSASIDQQRRLTRLHGCADWPVSSFGAQSWSYIFSKFKIHLVPLCENESSGVCGQRRPRSDCASAQSDLGLRCPLTESLDTTECMNGERKPGWYFAHAQDGLNARTTHIRRHFFAWCGPFDFGVWYHSE